VATLHVANREGQAIWRGATPEHRITRVGRTGDRLQTTRCDAALHPRENAHSVFGGVVERLRVCKTRTDNERQECEEALD
jgi:hypothetical protein